MEYGGHRLPRCNLHCSLRGSVGVTSAEQYMKYSRVLYSVVETDSVVASAAPPLTIPHSSISRCLAERQGRPQEQSSEEKTRAEQDGEDKIVKRILDHNSAEQRSAEKSSTAMGS